MFKRFYALALAGTMLLSMHSTALAAENPQIALPTSGATYQTEYNPLGVLSASERESLLSSKCTQCPQPYHFSVIPHSHEITSITDSYHGEISRGVVAETTRRVNTTTALTYSKERSYSNSYSVSIGFDKNVVNGELGFDVSYSDSSVAEYSVDVPANKMGSITLYDMYDVTKFNVKTTYVYDTIPISYSYEYGTGWAQQWTNFGFSARIW